MGAALDYRPAGRRACRDRLCVLRFTLSPAEQVCGSISVFLGGGCHPFADMCGLGETLLLQRLPGSLQASVSESVRWGRSTCLRVVS